MISDDIRAAVDKARSELMAIDKYLGRSGAPSMQRVAERAGVINHADYQSGKYGPMNAAEYFKAQGGAIGKLIEEMQNRGGVKSPMEKQAESTKKASDQTARNVERMEHRLVGEMSKDHTLLTRIATALERQNQKPIQVKVYGV